MTHTDSFVADAAAAVGRGAHIICTLNPSKQLSSSRWQRVEGLSSSYTPQAFLSLSDPLC